MATKAKESPQIQKARNKIKKQLAASEQRINEEALREMRSLIQKQLSRHTEDRIDLKSKQFTIFDENQHSAKTQSKFVHRLLRQLKHTPTKPPISDLEGRVSYSDSNSESEH